MTTIRQRVKTPGNEWQEMTALIFALEDDKKLPREVHFDINFPLDLAEAYEKFTGIPVLYINSPNIMEVSI